MFDAGQSTMKSNGVTIAIVLAVVLVILLGVAWYYTHT
jgi:hypothetical protein